MNKLFIYFIIVILSGLTALAQMPPESKPDAELTEDEAALRIQDFQARVNTLQETLNKLQETLNSNKADLARIQQEIKDCDEELKSLLGVTDSDIAAFRQKLGVIEGKVRELQRLPDSQLATKEKQAEVADLERQLNELRGNKISLLPEFYNKIIALAKDIRGLYREVRKETYTVGTWAENRDCLWNIAGKTEIYADPMLWPKIWQANKDEIRNPDIIFPGQVLTLPEKGPKTSEEKKAERKYWRMKKEQQAEVETGAGTE
jgi:nucleoid-associated protein YgaU